jgi:hypothetical protein
MNHIFVFAIWICCIPAVMAQQRTATISFDREFFDFGTIKEADGPATHQFNFTNTGSQPLLVTNVSTSCGCTISNWTKSPVMPGASGIVSATFDPRNRPGKFEKTITVLSNADRPSVSLKITGEVMQSTEQMYPFVVGPIRMRSSYLALTNVYMGEQKSVEQPILNSSSSPVQLSFAEVPANLQVSSVPSTLDGNQKGVIRVVYTSDKKGAWGLVSEHFKMLINGKLVENNTITVSANVLEDFSKLTPDELAKAPKIVFEGTTFDFDSIKSGAKIEHDFVFKNDGQTDLFIRNVSASCGCTVVKPKENIIKAGASSSIKAVFDSSGKKGVQNKAITVITNDPKNSKVVLWVRGRIN